MTISNTHADGGDATFRLTLKSIRPGWMIALGVLMTLTGAAALAFPFAATLTVEVMTGGFFLTAGVFTTVHALMDRQAEGMWWQLLTGVLYAVAGFLFLANPLGGIIAMTVLLGATFLAEGVLRIIMATRMGRSRYLFLMVASGALSILLGLLVLAGIANGASLTVVGVLLGINFIFSGVAATMLGLAGLRSAPKDAVA